MRLVRRKKEREHSVFIATHTCITDDFVVLKVFYYSPFFGRQYITVSYIQWACVRRKKVFFNLAGGGAKLAVLRVSIRG